MMERPTLAWGTVGVLLVLTLILSAVSVVAAQDKPQYAEVDACAMCHQDVADAQETTLHGAVLSRRAGLSQGRNCQTCHGPSESHTEDPTEVKSAFTPDSLGRNTSAKMCLTCHSNQVSAITWRRGDHNAGNVQCWDCHSEERPAKAHSNFASAPDSDVCIECHHEVKGLFRLNSHHPVLVEHEQRIECSDCHDPHGRIKPRDVSDICRSCHTPQHGPYRFEHGAISGRLMGSCVECHDPHGSPNADLLKFNSRGLCLQCHGDRVIHFPGPKCWDCHEAVHGSNSSPLLFTP